MSYKTNSTNLNKMSKVRRKNELQRLKNEYERIKDFSENTIAMRMKQVRLWRLFRKIQDINATSMMRPKHLTVGRKTAQQIRAETLARARELGTGYSRENGLNLHRENPGWSQPSMIFSFSRPTDEGRVSSRSRRLQYGNIQSHENMRRFKQGRCSGLNSPTSSCMLRSISSTEIGGVEKLHENFKYDGNESINLRDPQKGQSKLEKNPSEQSIKAEIEEVILEVGSAGVVPAVQNGVIRNYTFSLDDDINEAQNVDDHEDYLIALWNELKSRIPILSTVPLRQLISTYSRLQNIDSNKLKDDSDAEDKVSCDSDESVAEEYNLREVENDINIPENKYWLRKGSGISHVHDSIEDIPVGENERVIKISKYQGNVSQYYLNRKDLESLSIRRSSSTECACTKAKAKPQTTQKPIVQPNLKNKPLTSLEARRAQHALLLETHVKDFVKLYEPFPRFHQPQDTQQRIKDNYESGVEKLRSIFEHQGE